jgi:uncharacterized protein YecE (DUF72 family)
VAFAAGGWWGLAYLRVRGPTAVYRAAYGESRLRAYAANLAALPDDRPAWRIFDNIAASHALSDALMLEDGG